MHLFGSTHASLWFRTPTDGVDCLVYVGTEPTRRMHTAAMATASAGATYGADTPKRRIHSVPISRWGRDCGALVVRVASPAAAPPHAVLHEVAAALAPTSERERLLKNNVANERTLVRATEKRLLRLGFDLFFRSGLTNNLPAMIPVTMLYGTPDDAAAEIAYLKKRGYPIGYIEMGEEPDGKHAMPEDYAALYLQVADAIHKIDSSVVLGGPSLVTLEPAVKTWMDRFLDFLRARGRCSALFMSMGNTRRERAPPTRRRRDPNVRRQRFNS